MVSQQGSNVGAIALVVGPVMGYGLGKTPHYRNTHLQQQPTTYAAGQPLPANLRRKLKRCPTWPV